MADAADPNEVLVSRKRFKLSRELTTEERERVEALGNRPVVMFEYLGTIGVSVVDTVNLPLRVFTMDGE